MLVIKGLIFGGHIFRGLIFGRKFVLVSRGAYIREGAYIRDFTLYPFCPHDHGLIPIQLLLILEKAPLPQTDFAKNVPKSSNFCYLKNVLFLMSSSLKHQSLKANTFLSTPTGKNM